MLFSELREKEVICLSSGARLGMVDDLELNEQTAQIERLIIYGRSEMLGLGTRLEDVTIEWADVDTIGSDIILVRAAAESPVKKARKKTFLGL